MGPRSIDRGIGMEDVDAGRITQRQLAKKVGTTASVICRLEDADYQGHSLAMLRRIAAALGIIHQPCRPDHGKMTMV